ncbi:MAG: DUF3617 family protein [Thermodesulfobacteriota bacterium]
MLRLSSLVLIILGIFILIPITLHAQGELSIKPGKYRLSKTTKTSFDTVPASRTTEECITDPDLDPQSILPNKENCTISNMKTSDNQTSFDFTCENVGKSSTLKGYAEYSTDGDKISSSIRLKGLYQGKELIVESSGSGERIGDCTPEPEFAE